MTRFGQVTLLLPVLVLVWLSLSHRRMSAAMLAALLTLLALGAVLNLRAHGLL